jgi:hypothetical protein
VHGYLCDESVGAAASAAISLIDRLVDHRRSAVVSEDRPDQGESIDLVARFRAYESVRAVLAHDNVERGPAAARDVVTAVLAESGVDGLVEVAVELSLRLASAVERSAGDQGVAAVDLAEVRFVD